MSKIFSTKNARILLQLGLAFAFLYAAAASFMRPNDWVGYLPSFFRNFADPYLLLKLFSSGEIVLAVWILTGWKLFYSALLAAILLLAITIVDLSVLDVTFRDVSLALAALALAALAKNAN